MATSRFFCVEFDDIVEVCWPTLIKSSVHHCGNLELNSCLHVPSDRSSGNWQNDAASVHRQNVALTRPIANAVAVDEQFTTHKRSQTDTRTLASL